MKVSLCCTMWDVTCDLTFGNLQKEWSKTSNRIISTKHQSVLNYQTSNPSLGHRTQPLPFLITHLLISITVYYWSCLEIPKWGFLSKCFLDDPNYRQWGLQEQRQFSDGKRSCWGCFFKDSLYPIPPKDSFHITLRTTPVLFSFFLCKNWQNVNNSLHISSMCRKLIIMLLIASNDNQFDGPACRHWSRRESK